MKPIYKYDEDMNYLPLENKVIPEETPLPVNYTDIPPVYPDGKGMYKPVLYKNKTGWYETATPEYVDSLITPSNDPTDIELLGQSLSEARITVLKQNKNILLMRQQIDHLKGLISSSE